MLMLMYPKLSSKEMVGTDLVQAIPLVGAAALGHCSSALSTSRSSAACCSARSRRSWSARTSRRMAPTATSDRCSSRCSYLALGLLGVTNGWTADRGDRVGSDPGRRHRAACTWACGALRVGAGAGRRGFGVGVRADRQSRCNRSGLAATLICVADRLFSFPNPVNEVGCVGRSRRSLGARRH